MAFLAPAALGGFGAAAGAGIASGAAAGLAASGIGAGIVAGAAKGLSAGKKKALITAGTTSLTSKLFSPKIPQPSEARVSADAEAKKRLAAITKGQGFGSTLLTGGAGVKQGAQVAVKKLLGE